MSGIIDATPSWSGYVFQGEVALCRALEKINSYGNPQDIPHSYSLRLERDEDFSLNGEELEVFQVKAYVGVKTNRFSKYKNVVEELLDKYFYYSILTKNPKDKRKSTIKKPGIERKKPIRTFLITHSEITDFEVGWGRLDEKFKKVPRNFFDYECGKYTIDNISEKIQDEIRKLFPYNNDNDISIKYLYCTQTICSYVKERHLTKTRRNIPLLEIFSWMNKADLAFNEKIAWFSIEKKFFKKIQEIFEENKNDEDEEVQKQLKKLENLSHNLQLLPSAQLKSLIENNLTPFKTMDGSLDTFVSFLNDSAIRSILSKIIRRVDQEPNFRYLQYRLPVEENKIKCLQVTLDNNFFDLSDKFELNSFQKHIESLTLSPTSLDVDFYITEHLDFDKEKIKSMVNKVNEVQDFPTETTPEASNNILLDFNDELFGLISIENAVKLLNE